MISAGRILLAVPLVWLILMHSRTASFVAAALFVAGALTDGLDGYLARRWDTSTRTGQWLDPLADKAFVAAPVITLSIQGGFPVWAAVLILVREVGIVAPSGVPGDAGGIDAGVLAGEGEDHGATGGHHDVHPAAGRRLERGEADRSGGRGRVDRCDGGAVRGRGPLAVRRNGARRIRGRRHVKAEIVGVGTELLLGQIANENARYISEHLAEIGVDVLYHQAVGDNLERIAATCRLALSRADVVIVTGGLGPTQDDITREGLALAIDVRLSDGPRSRSSFASASRHAAGACRR